MEREALKLALEALEDENSLSKMETARGILRKALAQEQEPFTYYDPVRDAIRPFPSDGDIPLYTTPPQRPWVGLTNNELQPIADEYRILFGSWVEDFARAIEAKLKEKNT